MEPPASDLLEGEPIVPPRPPGTVLPEVTLVTVGGVAGELPKESSAQDASAAGVTDPGTSIAQTTSTTGLGAGDVGAVRRSEPSAEVANDLIEDPDLSKEKRDHVLDVFKDLYGFTTNLMDRSQEKSKKLKLLQDGLLQLQEKDHKISEEVRRNSELQKKLKRLEADRARESLSL
ncbi:hypothetical protein C2845_PM11G00320 [Panicum miliaceum]|uniref:Uncharacterized protein n=1 Tax=Panicum miliaceum TaxID=4540 RepID=A0A3L6RPU4_PANMI|nr:hypothetical protein C2845_PM11G00320 [Panicum miliaceum]